MSAELIAQGLCKTYGAGRAWFGKRHELKAVDGVDLHVQAGQTLGLAGESGCGKSTVARMILGLIEASAGKVTFAGETINAKQDAAWRRQRCDMQLVQQDPLAALDRRMSAVDQVAEALQIHGPGISRKERLERARDILAATGIRAEHCAKFPHELSGGQRQRIVIARALILEPKLLVCDEPVSALDVSVQAQVINLLQDIQAQRGLTCVFISHDLRIVRHVSDKVAVMYLGRIVEYGAPDAVLKAPQHPYTQALVAALPHPGQRRRERFSLQGEPPNPIDRKPGCAFHPRCPSALRRCAQEAPVLADTGAGHLAACHLLTAAANGAVARSGELT
jgi:oligopeptide/dipeptide ABC transporter ATP-binding protein